MRLAVYGALGLWTFVCLFPFYWLVVTSLKVPIDVSTGPFYLPFVDFEPTLHAWQNAVIHFPDDALKPFINTILVTFTATALTVALAAFAAYALTRFSYRVSVARILCFVLVTGAASAAILIAKVDWRIAVAVASVSCGLVIATVAGRRAGKFGNSFILFGILATRILPPIVIAVPLYVAFQAVGLLDTRAALIVTYVAANLPIAIWLLRDAFAAIPIDLEEAAIIEGASRVRILISIVLPLAAAVLATTFLFLTVLCWNEYLFAATLSADVAQTMPAFLAGQMAVREQMASSEPRWGYFSALILIMVAPLIGLAWLLQRLIAYRLMKSLGHELR